MKVKDLKKIIDTYNPELEISFIVVQMDKGEGGEDIVTYTTAEDYFTYEYNSTTNQLEIKLDL